jgi:hypothetical protein
MKYALIGVAAMLGTVAVHAQESGDRLVRIPVGTDKLFATIPTNGPPACESLRERVKLLAAPLVPGTQVPHRDVVAAEAALETYAACITGRLQP